MENQEDAILLACCNCIGNAAYDNQGVAAYLCERLKTLHTMGQADFTCPQWREKSIERYNYDPLKPVPIPSLSRHSAAPFVANTVEEEEEEMHMPTGEDMLFQVAYNTCKGDLESASRKILQDFRQGRMGPMALQVAPSMPRDNDDGRGRGSTLSEEEGGQIRVDVRRNVAILGETPRSIEEADMEDMARKEERVMAAVQKAKDRGLDLPPVLEGALDKDGDDDNKEADIGKGLFDGW